MKVAVIGCLHGNVVGLEAVLADAVDLLRIPYDTERAAPRILDSGMPGKARARLTRTEIRTG